MVRVARGCLSALVLASCYLIGVGLGVASYPAWIHAYLPVLRAASQGAWSFLAVAPFQYGMGALIYAPIASTAGLFLAMALGAVVGARETRPRAYTFLLIAVTLHIVGLLLGYLSISHAGGAGPAI